MKKSLSFARVFMLLCIGLCMLWVCGNTAVANRAVTTSGGATGTNAHGHAYSSNWARRPYSFLYEKDGRFSRVEATGTQVVVENYSSDYVLLSTRRINYELPLFGGFYNGQQYFYLVFGQVNTNDSDNAEVIRVVKYDKNWNRLGAASYYGCNTYEPFSGGNLSFAEYGDLLYFRTCHTMYKSSDGYHHQACMTFVLKQSDLSKVDQYYNVMNVTFGYVSHSFNQFIRVAGNKVVAVDHGDAYPRAVVLGAYPDSADVGRVSTRGYQYNYLLRISGTIGSNYTGVEVGGFEASSSHYLVAAASVDQQNFSNSKVKNIIVMTQPLASFDEASIVTKHITNYAESGDTSATNPYLIPIGNDLFVLAWEENNVVHQSSYTYVGSPNGKVRYALLDRQGNVMSEIKTMYGSLSDCQPIFARGKLVWYVTDNSSPVFYEMDIPSLPVPSGIGMYLDTLDLEKGQSQKLNVLVVPDSASDKSVTWSSGNPAVASVDANGVVTAKASGTTVITAMTVNGLSASCVVNVKIPLTGFTLNRNSAILIKGTELTLVPTFIPDDASDKTVNYSSSAPDVATVDQSGVVTAKKIGQATITATCANRLTASCAITVLLDNDSNNPFADIKSYGSWEFSFAKYVYEKNIMSGKGKIGEKVVFGPSDPITRAEFATVLYNKEKRPNIEYTAQFADVPNDKWFTKPILWAYSKNITKGYGSSFGVNDNITREQIAQMLYAYASSKGIDVSVDGVSLDRFADAGKVSNWAENAMKWATSHGVINGTSDSVPKLNPMGKATRAECAAMIKNYIEKVENAQ